MNNYDKILELIKKNKGYVTTSEIVKNNINKYFLTKMVKNGQIKRISRGYYGLNDFVSDPYFEFQIKSKNAVFSLLTSLYLLNISDRIPLVFNITVPQGYNGKLQNSEDISLNYVKKELLDLGAIEVESPYGSKIKIYDLERTICDIIKYKNKVDAEIFSKAIKKYVSSKNKDLNKLIKYAKKMKIENRVRNYMEVML